MLVIYLVLTFFCGKYLYSLFIKEHDEVLLMFPIYGLLGFGIHFLIWILLNVLFGIHSPLFSIIIISILGGICFLRHTKNFNFKILKLSQFYKLSGPILAFLLITIQYVADFFQIIRAVIKKNGLIHQDILFHSAISNSIIEFGYPIRDLFYQGIEIKYHIFSHFICSQFGYILSLEMPLVYTVFFQIFTLLLSSILAYHLLNLLITRKSKHYQLAILVGLVFNLCFLPIKRFTGLNLPKYLSYSYEWQIICFLSLFIILEKLNRKYGGFFNAKMKDYILIIILSVLAIFSKISSLPILLFGFGMLIIIELIKTRKFNVKPIYFFIFLIGISFVIFVIFFNSNYSTIKSNFTKMNMPFLVNMVPSTVDNLFKLGCKITSMAYSKLNPLFIFLFTIFSALNFRILFLKKLAKHSSVGILVLMLNIIGLYFFFFLKYNHWYFMNIAMFVSGIYAISLLSNYWKEYSIKLKLLACILILFSTYPICTYGKTFKTYMKKHRAAYFPMTPDKFSLYNKVKNSTEKSDLIFTPSLYATLTKIPDNYYPPAYSGRQFLLAGYRFSNGINHKDFISRKNLCDNFNFVADSTYLNLKKYNVDFILTEHDIYDHDTISQLKSDINKNPNYILLFENDAGFFVKLN
jgi:hypothetical protein